MNKRRTLSRRELLDRLYESADHDVDQDLLDDESPIVEKSGHPEAPLNDRIELEKRIRRSRAGSAGSERDLEEELEFLEFLAQKRVEERLRRQLAPKRGNDYDSPLPCTNSAARKRASCRPIFIGCALTCIVTAGIVKGQDIMSFISSVFNPAQQTQTTQPLVRTMQPRLAPRPGLQNTWLTSTPMVTDRTNSMERVAGLSASKSTITGFADSQSMTAAYYWTLLVSNSGQQNQEARMRIALPAGATLSRATLWVNGTPQEAAFSTTEQVTAAYNWVRDGREQRVFLSHDPLVITQESPGHLLVKAAPITPDGKPLQLRLGFTAPLIPTATESASMRLPQITESNFDVNGTQDVHLESPTSIWSNESEVTAIPDQSGFMLRGNIGEDRLTSLRVNVARNGSDQFATRATHSPKGTFIVASMKPDAAGHMSLSLKKTSTHPTCRIINSEPAAARLSTLWAYGQVEAAVKRGDRFTANDLASVFRVVSSVSGATVLEQDSDYAMQGLSRNQFATYDRRAADASRGASFAAMAPALPSPIMPSPVIMRVPPVMHLMRPPMPSAQPAPKAPAVHIANPVPSLHVLNYGPDSFSRELNKDADNQEVSISDEGPTANAATAQPEKIKAEAEKSVPATDKSVWTLILPVTLVAGLVLAFAKFGKALPIKLSARVKK